VIKSVDELAEGTSKEMVNTPAFLVEVFWVKLRGDSGTMGEELDSAIRKTQLILCRSPYITSM